jgi:hypothetical protein
MARHELCHRLAADHVDRAGIVGLRRQPRNRAWCKFVGWAARCLELHDSRLFFGTNDGKVFEGEINGTDDTGAIYYTYVGNPDHMKTLGQLKTVHEASRRSSARHPTARKSRSRSTIPSRCRRRRMPPRPVRHDLWDSGLWDVAKWDQAAPTPSVGGGQWISIGKTGYVVQPHLQITGYLGFRPNTEFVQLDVTFEDGGVLSYDRVGHQQGTGDQRRAGGLRRRAHRWRLSRLRRAYFHGSDRW